MRIPIQEFYVYRQERKIPPSTIAYEPRKDLTGWRLILMNTAFYVLNKLRCFQGDKVEFTRCRVPLQTEFTKVLDRIDKIDRNFRSLELRIRTILIGPETFDELVYTQDFQNHWIAETVMITKGMYSSGQIRHAQLPVDLHIVPTIEGIVVLPGRIDVDARYRPNA